MLQRSRTRTAHVKMKCLAVALLLCAAVAAVPSTADGVIPESAELAADPPLSLYGCSATCPAGESDKCDKYLDMAKAIDCSTGLMFIGANEGDNCSSLQSSVQEMASGLALTLSGEITCPNAMV